MTTLITLAGLAGFQLIHGAYAKEIRSPFPADDVVISVSGRATEGSSIGIEIQPSSQPGAPFFRFPTWSEDDAQRTSHNDQKNAFGTVYTDTLILNQPETKWRIRVTMNPGAKYALLNLDHLDISFVNSKSPRKETQSSQRAWGKQIAVPKRNQGNYANGGVLCSPTSTSMILAHWAEQTRDIMMDADVPWVQSRVFDPAYGGAGNWAFNTAFAASRGLRAYVSRLNNIAELESWIEFGIPVVTSVSYDLLKGKGLKGENDGHLVVLIGFTKDGDPVFNDPGRSLPPQMVYKRADFDAAWKSSGRAVYLMYPRGWRIPRGGPWAR